MKMKDFNLTIAMYKKIIGKEEQIVKEVPKTEEHEFSLNAISTLVKRLSEVPESYMLEILKWYADAKEIKLDFDIPQFQILFKQDDAKLLRQLDQMISKKIQELKELKSRRTKK